MKYTLFIPIFLISLITFGQNSKPYVIYSGKIKNTKETAIRVTNFDSSYTKDIAIDASGNFRDTLFISEPGCFFFQSGKSYSTMFLKFGDNLKFYTDADDFFNSMKFSGQGSELNNFSVAIKQLRGTLIVDPKAYFVVPLADFLVKLEKHREILLAFLENSTIKGEEKQIQKNIIEQQHLLTKNNYDKFVFFHTKVHPVLPSNYYDEVKKLNLDDDVSFKNNKDFRVLVVENFLLTSKEALEKDPSLTILEFTKNKVKDIKSLSVRESIVSMLFKQMNINNKNYKSDYTEIMAMLTTPNLKEKLTARYNGVTATKPEMPSFDFNYENHKGGNTSLSDFKGKLVYIEIWATWCGPCINEQPALTQLIKDFKGKNIEFVSVSIDIKNDYQKWRIMVEKNKVGGVQLISDKSLQSDFMKAFSVGLIPRSILLDENGKIINPHAPRPSDSETKRYIDSLLQKTSVMQMN
jgi:thiol-disulfide isomerase/thioredoxin